MNMLKRSLALVLALCMMLSVLPFGALATESEPVDTGAITGEPVEPVTDEPADNEPAEEEPVDDEPVIEEPVDDEPVVEEPSDDEPVVEEPADDEPVVDEPVDDEPVVDEPADDKGIIVEEEVIVDSAAEEAIDGAAETAVESVDYRMLFLDCGRKYFSKDWIIALINEADAAGYTHLQLAFGNDGLRFLLNDMSVTSNGTTYAHADVVAGIETGNSAQNSSGDPSWLTEDEMDAIIAHANTVGLGIIPVLNTPGHMEAIITAMQNLNFSSPQYSSSEGTVDVADTTALAFVQQLVYKYMNYFAGKGCTAFNIGADEYANDINNTPQFSALVSGGNYDEFITYVNALATYALGKGMAPMAFNDGIYYAENTSNGTINENIKVCYWSSGWSGHNVASASYLADKGFQMINTHGDYYYVLGKTDTWDNNGYTAATGFDVTQFSKYTGSSWTTETISDPVGAMFCIWCDYPTAETETQVAANVRLALRAMAAEMQGNDGSAISTAVISGGFNENGSINSSSAEEDTTVTVTGVPASMTVGETVTLSLSSSAAATWTSSDENVVSLTAATRAAVESQSVVATAVGEGTATITAQVDDTTSYTAQINVVAAADAEDTYDVLVELAVDETKVITDNTGNYEDAYNNATEGKPDESIATVAVSGTTGTATLTAVTSAAGFDSSKKYLIVNTRAATAEPNYSVLTSESYTSGNADWLGTLTGLAMNGPVSADSTAVWTITPSENGYTISAGSSYLGIGNKSASMSSTATEFTMTYTASGWTIYSDGYYLSDLAGTTLQGAFGWNDASDGGNYWTIYEVPTSENSTTITIEGVKVGETTATVGSTIYKIVVSPKEVTATVVLAGYRTFEDASTNVAVEDPTIVDATLENGTLTITGKVVGNTTVTTDNAVYTITVSEVDLSAVKPLTIEYWITNGQVTDNAYTDSTNLNYLSINASDEGIYSESGVAISTLVPATASRENRTLEFWQTKLLDKTLTNDSASGTQEQTTAEGDDETLEGSAITHVRYWNGTWQVLAGSTWTDVTDNHQLVAYYLEIIEIANSNGETELFVNAADWGFASGDNWGYWTGDFSPCTVSVQIVYEDGTTNPGDTTVNTLLTKTLVYGYWDGGRGLGTMIFTGDDYNIYKVTAETGDATYTNSSYGFTINNLTWDSNEETVWSGDATNSVSIGNPARKPSYEAPKDNLTWNTGDYNENNAILIRVYVKAVETEDSLTVVYYDEKFGDTLYTYNINVPSGTIFSNDYFNPDPTTFTGNADRIDVSNAGIVNTNGVTQYFQTDLTQVPEAVGKYNSGLYEYTGSVISEDGKTLYLYYNIDTEVLSPNFVADFGLPLTFNLSDVVGEDQEELVKTVTATANTRYGTLAYNADTKVFTYTPTAVLQNIDVLTISILFDGADAATTTNVGVTPATTVHYEEGFITTFSNGWTAAAKSSVAQTTEVFGEHVYNYGYQPGYTGNSNTADVSAIGETASFTFTGTGIDLYAYCDAAAEGETAYISVQIVNQETGNNVYMVNTKVIPGTTYATSGQTVGLKALPAVSVDNLKHATYTVNLRKIMDTDTVHIDGFRVYNTLSDKALYVDDHEDNPEFYELRDRVLHVIDSDDSTTITASNKSSQVYAELTADGEEPTAVVYSAMTTNVQEAAQDLLDNGPKNELFLYAGQTLSFNVSTERAMQIGMKAPLDATSYTVTVNGTEQTGTISTSIDMFYEIVDFENTGTSFNVNITNTGNSILSITKLKICDDPNAAFLPLTEENIYESLVAIGYEADSGSTEPETPVDPETPETPETPVDPEVVYADATLNVALVDYSGKEIAATALTKNGVEGQAVTFTAAEIEAVVAAQMPANYALVTETFADVETTYGETAAASVQIGKVATLKVTYINMLGKKVGSATMIDIQTSANSRANFSAAEIKAAAPSGCRVITATAIKVSYGSERNIVVTVMQQNNSILGGIFGFIGRFF